MKPRWFTQGDLDGFFGLFVDNLLQLMVIDVLSKQLCGLPTELVNGRILPAAAVSILVGNLFYSWQAWRLMRKTGREDVTALPYGINTPSLIAYILLIMAPVYQETKNPTLVWQIGLFACLLSGVIEVAGAFVGDWLRRNTPRAALLSALAGVAITFIAMGFVFRIFASPLIALVPAVMVLVTYAAELKLPWRLPGGLLAVLMGVALAWGLKALGIHDFQPSSEPYVPAFHLPAPVPGDLFTLIADPRAWSYLAVISPMGLFNVIGSLQNLESAEAAGDRYETRPSLLANGIGSLAAAFLGSPFPTTIYIGHPAWKAMGARAGYSALNGLVITVLCLIGGVTLVLKVVPMEAALGILLWIGLIITAQAFQETPRRHALAVAIGLIPSMAAWALFLITATLGIAGKPLHQVADQFKGQDIYIAGVIALSQGFLINSMVLASILAFMIDRRFLKAAAWSLAAAALSALGVIHAYEIAPAGVQNVFGFMAAPGFAAAYALSAALLAGCQRLRDRLF